MLHIEVFIGQIVAAGEAHLAVYHGNLAMVAVVHKCVYQRHDGIKHPAVDALLPHVIHKVRADEAERTHIVVKQAYLHARRRALSQYFLQLHEAGRQFYRMIFHKNELLRPAQTGLHILKRRLAGGMEIHLRVQPRRILAPISNVAQVSRQIRVFGLCGGDGLAARFRRNGQMPVYALKAPPDGIGGPRLTHQHIQAQTQHRREQDQRDPARLGSGNAFLAVNAQRARQR